MSDPAYQPPADPAAAPPVDSAATPPPPSAAPAAPAAPAQFGGSPAPASDSTPAISSEGGYVAKLPLLTTGAYGPVVAFLAKLLDRAGFPNHVHAGKAEPILDDALMLLVKQFQRTVGVDPSAPQDGAAPLIRKDHEGLVDAKTWQHLLGDVAHAVEDRYPFLEASA